MDRRRPSRRGLLADLLHRPAPEIVGREHRVGEVGRHAEAVDVDRRLPEVARPLGGRDDQRDAAVVDQAVVEQAQRLADEARGRDSRRS